MTLDDTPRRPSQGGTLAPNPRGGLLFVTDQVAGAEYLLALLKEMTQLGEPFKVVASPPSAGVLTRHEI